MELQVLKGGAELIRKLKPILYVENDRKEKATELVRYIDSIGYDMYAHNPRLFNPNNYFKNSENVFGEIVSGNMLCMPKGTPVTGLPRVAVP